MNRRTIASLAVSVFVLSACGFRVPLEQTLSPKEIAEVVASPDRSAADRTNDLRRKPDQMLAFIGVKPGSVALDISAAGGYTTELLARAIGSNGAVYGQSAPPRENAPRPAQPEGNSSGMAAPAAPPAAAQPATAPVRRTSPEQLATRVEAMRAAKGVQFAPIVAVVQPFDNPVPPQVTPGKLDLVTFMFNYHDMGFMGVDRAAMNRAVFNALKPGGQYVIADHAGRPGTGISESGTLHRMEEAFLIQEVEAAGFKLAAKGDFLRNPNDPKDKNTPDPPQPKDDFVVKFVKP
ncbi:MAG: methyltransferase [Rhodospirillales bacterium]|nr:methyltransferase [Rhodospirillales bacterium]